MIYSIQNRQKFLFCDLPAYNNKKVISYSYLSNDSAADRLTILSMGLGQDSSAIAILLAVGKLPQYRNYSEPVKDIKIIFSDTGVEWPETYEWREELKEWLSEWGLEIITLEKGSRYHDLPAVDKWYLSLRGIPTRQRRSCTIRHKVNPIRRWINHHASLYFGADNKHWYREGRTPHRMLIGIAAEESHRACRSDVRYIENHYPLLELGLDRIECQKIIKKAGFKTLPIKSGCVCCPFQPDGWYYSLSRMHRSLWKRTVLVELNALSRNPKLNLKGSKPITEKILDWKAKNPNVIPEDIIRGNYTRTW